MENVLSSCRDAGTRALARAAFCCLALVLTGCTGLKQYRTGERACDTTASPTECQTNSIEVTANYVLGVVEFDDQGWLWSRKQMNAVFDRLADEDSTNGLLIVVFVH